MIVAFCIFTEEVYDRVFGRNEWQVFEDDAELERDDEVEYAEEIYDLTESGEEYVREYLEDYSCGYDLCYGRMKGLAAQYTWDKFFNMITNKECFSTKRE